MSTESDLYNIHTSTFSYPCFLSNNSISEFSIVPKIKGIKPPTCSTSWATYSHSNTRRPKSCLTLIGVQVPCNQKLVTLVTCNQSTTAKKSKTIVSLELQNYWLLIDCWIVRFSRATIFLLLESYKLNGPPDF